MNSWTYITLKKNLFILVIHSFDYSFASDLRIIQSLTLLLGLAVYWVIPNTALYFSYDMNLSYTIQVLLYHVQLILELQFQNFYCSYSHCFSHCALS